MTESAKFCCLGGEGGGGVKSVEKSHCTRGCQTIACVHYRFGRHTQPQLICNLNVNQVFV